MKLFGCTHHLPGIRQSYCRFFFDIRGFDRFERVASKDYQLGEYHISKGMIIDVPVYPIHHDPHVWPEPEKFIPERYIFKLYS